jgi:RHS repeat-associated protein
VTDAAGAVIERHDYLPFGEEWCGTAVCGANRTPGQPLRFTGKERDAETGLDYFGARYYRANAGRFTTVDPLYVVSANLADPQLWNRYTYVRNNPLRHRDPDGRFLDTLADIAAIEYDVLDIGVTLYTGGSLTSTHFTALGGDVVGAIVPFVTGVGAGIRAAGKADHAVDLLKAGDKASDAVKGAGKADGARFIVEPNGTAVDRLATPPGRYRQPEGHLTDVLQKADHGSGHSHTHEVARHRNPRDASKGSTQRTGVTRPVSASEAGSIQRGDATKLPPRGRQ